MRIIAGKARGIKLTTPKDNDTRPTTDRVRESVFATLGDLTDLEVVDLFAGTGAMGLEAISRGAKKCVFVESSTKALQILETNIDKVLGQWQKSELTPTIQVAGATVEKAIHRIINEITPNIIFADPPYKSENAKALLKLECMAQRWKKAILVLEHDAKAELPWAPIGNWKIIKQKKYGQTIVSIAGTTES